MAILKYSSNVIKTMSFIHCFYLRDLSSKFHSFYNAEKIISDDKDHSDAKIALSIAIKEIINNGLKILGISCPESM